MKFFSNKLISKRIIVAILLIMSFNFILPTVSSADIGGDLFSPIASLLRAIGDLVIEGLQSYFMDDGDIKVEDPLSQSGEKYYIEYSPGMIFSNKVAGLDVNFFNPGEGYQKTEELSKIVQVDKKEIKKGPSSMDGATNISDEEINSTRDSLLNGLGYSPDIATEYSELYKFVDLNSSSEHINAWTWKNGEDIYYYAIGDTTSYTGKDNQIKTRTMTFYLYKENKQILVKGEKIESSASILQGTVSTWYKALRAIALVGLLSVLVYVGIRILLSSTGQEKAKYKKMIMDWLVAIFILFVLQYIMIFTLEITNKITEVLSVNIVGAKGQDTLMSDIRNKVGGEKFWEIFSELIIYLVLVILTCVFTIQYLKRLLYMAFFTLVAPLIALTYPLDKIKDGQAQAFTMWIREYIFNALLQPMHLLIYFIFVTSASELVNVETGNPVYAMVAIGFIVPAEKFFRKMFGFEKAESASAMGAAAGGALVMNAINKMGSGSRKQASGGAKSSGSSNGGDSGGGGAPRYVPSPDGLNSNFGGSSNGSPTGGNGGSGGSSFSGAASSVGSSGGSTRTTFGQTVNPASQRGTRSFRNGAKTLAGHYINKSNGKKLLKGAGRLARKGIIGAAGALTLGTVGLAAGIATGDASKALNYGVTGAGVGYIGANDLGDKAVAFEKKNREIFKEGAVGTQEYNTREAIQELTSDNDFNRDCKNLKVTKKAEKENLIRQFYGNGIKKSSEIKKAINIRVKTGASQNEIIAAHKIRLQAEKDKMKRKDIENSLRVKGVTGENLDKAMRIIDML